MHAPRGLLLHRFRVVHLDAIARSVRRVERRFARRESADFGARAGRHLVHHQEAGGELRMRIGALRRRLKRCGAFRIGNLPARDAEPLLTFLRPHARLYEPAFFVADCNRDKRVLAIDRDCIAAAVAPAVRAACEAEHLAVLIDACLRTAFVHGAFV